MSPIHNDNQYGYVEECILNIKEFSKFKKDAYPFKLVPKRVGESYLLQTSELEILKH